MKIWSRTSRYMSMDDVYPPPLKELYEYWQSKTRNREPPAQADLKIGDFPQCLNNIALIQIQSDFEDSRYLIVGGALKRLLGKDPVGKTLSEVYEPEIASEVATALQKVAVSGVPSFYVREFQILGKSFGYCRLLLPLQTKRAVIDRVLIGIYPTSAALTHARQWQSAVADLDAQKAAEGRLAEEWVIDVSRDK